MRGPHKICGTSRHDTRTHAMRSLRGGAHAARTSPPPPVPPFPVPALILPGLALNNASGPERLFFRQRPLTRRDGRTLCDSATLHMIMKTGSHVLHLAGVAAEDALAPLGARRAHHAAGEPERRRQQAVELARLRHQVPGGRHVRGADEAGVHLGARPRRQRRPLARNLPALAEAGCRAYAVDLLGYGYSDKPFPTSDAAVAVSGEKGRALGAPEVEPARRRVGGGARTSTRRTRSARCTTSTRGPSSSTTLRPRSPAPTPASR